MSELAVPREIAPGVIWDASAQESFEEKAGVYEFQGRMSRADAEQEARWAVEQDLHRKFVKDQVACARGCRTNNEKRELVAEWTRLYGKERSDRLVKAVKGSGA